MFVCLGSALTLRLTKRVIASQDSPSIPKLLHGMHDCQERQHQELIFSLQGSRGSTCLSKRNDRITVAQDVVVRRVHAQRATSLP